MSTTTTRNLLSKTFCYTRQLAWDLQDNRTPIVSLATINHLQAQLKHRPLAEILQAAQELGITINGAHRNEC